MKIPEEYRWVYEQAESSKNGPTPFTGAAIMQLIERIAALTEQLEVKELEKQNKQQCVADLKSNLAKLESELTQTKAENERLTKWGEGWQKGCIEEQASNARLARERDSLRARLEHLSRPVTAAEFSQACNHDASGKCIAINGVTVLNNILIARQLEISE